MPVVMREKMEDSFGMDLSAVKLYENRAVEKAGAEAVTQGSNIAFAPGKLDFSSTRGQALLGHEISHVASQARGEVKGKGLVNDSALEARADREGMMAARGESVATAPLSSASAASAAGPMQAKSGKKKSAKAQAMDRWKEEESLSSLYSTREADADEAMDRENDIDRMYRIQAAMMREGAADNPQNPLLKEGDYEWYKNMQQNADMETFAGIQNRMVNSAQSLVNFRNSMVATGLEEFDLPSAEKKILGKSKKNYLSSYSNEGMEYDIYASLLNSMSNSKGGQQKTAQDRLNKTEPDATDQMLMEAKRIQNSRNANDGDVNGNPDTQFISLYRTNNLGRRIDDMRKKTRLKRFDNIAMGSGEKEETAEDEQTRLDIDRLFAISCGDDAGAKIPKEEMDWFNATLQDTDPKRVMALYKGLNNRLLSANAKIGENWEKAGGKNLDLKTSFELTQTDDALLEFQQYQNLFRRIDESFQSIMTADQMHAMMADHTGQQSVNLQTAAEKGDAALNHSIEYLDNKNTADEATRFSEKYKTGEKIKKQKKIYEQYMKKRKK